MKLCKNCEHYDGDRFSQRCHVNLYKERCKVTGIMHTLGKECSFAMRSKFGGCGPDAKLFKKISRKRKYLNRLRDPIVFFPLFIFLTAIFSLMFVNIFS